MTESCGKCGVLWDRGSPEVRDGYGVREQTDSVLKDLGWSPWEGCPVCWLVGKLKPLLEAQP